MEAPRSIKIALLGYGKMGKLVEQAAKELNHQIVGAVTSKRPTTHPDSIKAIAAADLCIDFSHPSCVLGNIKAAASQGKSLVVGTTGWSDHLHEIRKLVETQGIGLIHSPNFSIGIALFMKIAENAASLIGAHFEYDIAGIELHHKHKADAPSGTALALAEKVNRRRPRESRPLEFASVRTGSIPGTHTILFDSPADTITLSHEARSRDGFARGAVKAAEWIHGKKGFYTLDDLIRTTLCA